MPAHQELAHKEAELPTEPSAAETPLATQEEVAEAEPVAVVEESPEERSEAEASAVPVQPAEEVPGRPETPVDVSGGAGPETTLEDHETAVGEPPAAGSNPEEKQEDESAA